VVRCGDPDGRSNATCGHGDDRSAHSHTYLASAHLYVDSLATHGDFVRAVHAYPRAHSHPRADTDCHDGP